MNACSQSPQTHPPPPKRKIIKKIKSPTGLFQWRLFRPPLLLLLRLRRLLPSLHFVVVVVVAVLTFSLSLARTRALVFRCHKRNNNQSLRLSMFLRSPSFLPDDALHCISPLIEQRALLRILYTLFSDCLCFSRLPSACVCVCVCLSLSLSLS